MFGLIVSLAILGYVTIVDSKTYFSEDFGSGWEKRWVKSTFKGSEAGRVDVTAGKFYNDKEKDAGLHTTEDARFYQVSATFDEFTNKDKPLAIQYRVKHEQHIDCGGGYLKIGPKGLNQDKFNGDDTYNIMFGPDICGSTTKKVHVILNYKNQNHLINKNIICESDEKSHLYTLFLMPDNTYEVWIDGIMKEHGSLKDDWNMLAPKEIPDPKAKKPSTWDDRKEIPDPDDKKPDNWDDIPAQIRDPEAKKPDDWDDELDGEWEAPMIDNPEYQGEWEPDMIPNPSYSGEWVHPKIPNPEYKDDDTLYQFKSFGYVGLEVWQVKAGSIFDNILISDDVEDTKKQMEEFKKLQKGENAAFDKMKEAEKKKAEEERLKREAEEAANSDDDDDEEEKDEL